MRYIDPNEIVQNRLGDTPRPSFQSAVMVFHSQTRSQFTIDRLKAVPFGCKFLTVRPEDTLVAESGSTLIVPNISTYGGGGPLTSTLVEELAVCGVKTIVGIGSGGSIDPNIPRGAQFVIDRALCTDGSSRIYLGQDRGDLKIDQQTVDTTLRVAANLGTELLAATGVTVDVMYRESPELVAGWRKLGGQCINMEVTPMYTAAEACGIRAVYLGHVSDELFGDSWTTWFGNERARMADLTAELGCAVLHALRS